MIFPLNPHQPALIVYQQYGFTEPRYTSLLLNSLQLLTYGLVEEAAG